jgi:hypothetical protein
MSITDSALKDLATTHKSPSFSQDDVQKAFIIWYNAGKPTMGRFKKLLEENFPEWEEVPSTYILNRWITEIFTPRAFDMDEEVARSLEVRLIKDKVEMFQRHAKMARDLQNMAIEFLEENGLGNSRNAVTALVEALKIERESVGMDRLLEKITNKTDEELLNDLKSLVRGPIVSMEANDDV